MPEGQSAVGALETLLKQPGRIIYELQQNWRANLSAWLLIFALIGIAAYGLVVGSFSGGKQLWIAPAKLSIGTLFSIVICLPSLYIFACLAGVETRVRTIAGVFFAAVALTSLLLIGFAPVAWIFSQATDSVAFMGAFHLLLWAIAIGFGLRLIVATSRLLTGYNHGHLNLWSLIFILVCLQMMTTLRPIVGKSDRFFPGEKKFFVAHWFDTMNQPGNAKSNQPN
ncbi:MAG TPA: hypothetical protein VJ719_05555 [Chthoniobacterales bacterium]|nr:hypothetical protein [Chthoniobacterales bacterium]